MFRCFPKKGDRVFILRQDIYHLKHRRIITGRVIRIDGWCIYVRPSWCDWEIELYPNEVRVLRKKRKKDG